MFFFQTFCCVPDLDNFCMCSFFWSIVIRHFGFSYKYNHVSPHFFLIKKDLQLETLDIPQF